MPVRRFIPGARRPGPRDAAPRVAACRRSGCGSRRRSSAPSPGWSRSSRWRCRRPGALQPLYPGVRGDRRGGVLVDQSGRAARAGVRRRDAAVPAARCAASSRRWASFDLTPLVLVVMIQVVLIVLWTPAMACSGIPVILDLHVQPGASRSEFAGTHGERIKVRLAARGGRRQGERGADRVPGGLISACRSATCASFPDSSRGRSGCIERPMEDDEKSLKTMATVVYALQAAGFLVRHHLDRGGDHRLREAGRSEGHLARIALQLADPHLLVGPALGRDRRDPAADPCRLAHPRRRRGSGSSTASSRAGSTSTTTNPLPREA